MNYYSPCKRQRLDWQRELRLRDKLQKANALDLEDEVRSNYSWNKRFAAVATLYPSRRTRQCTATEWMSR